MGIDDLVEAVTKDKFFVGCSIEAKRGSEKKFNPNVCWCWL